MRKYLSLCLVFALAGCQSFLGSPAAVQLGKQKFSISYAGPEGAGVHAAQNFCTSRGFAYAAVVMHTPNKVTFFCMRGGEHIPASVRLTCMNSADGAKVCGRFR